MSTQQLKYKVTVQPPFKAQIYIGFPTDSDGYSLPAELRSGVSFMSEQLTSFWGALDKKNSMRFRIRTISVRKTEDLSKEVKSTLDRIKEEWEMVLLTTENLSIADLVVPSWKTLS